MKIISCIPLAGQGVLARYGDLVAVTDGRDADPGPLLSALAEVAATHGDGRALVRSVARAALDCPGQPAWACAGVAAGGGVDVLVYGRARATVRVDDGQEVTLTSSGSLLPVSWTFTGTTVTIGLGVGEPAPADPQCWLGGGVVPGGGLVVTVSAEAGLAVRAPATGGETWGATRPPTEPAAWHPSTSDSPAAASPAADPPAADPLAAGAPLLTVADGAADADQAPVVVEGVLCAREHFNDPGARDCRQCGTSLDQLPRNFDRRRRPPLGVLVLDDGTRFTLDRDYVLGREPVLDGDVVAGRARPLRISDPDGTVSRLHLRVSLVGWQVEVSDLGSANGSVLKSAGDNRALAPFEPTVIEPGTRIGIGRRSMQYLFSEGALQ